MASSVQQKYQVFLSFRGEDTRLNFTSHLCEALKRKGIRYFIDDQLIRGEEISPSLLTAIEESTISIIILSENYASSSWCLEELSKILECKKTYGQIVLPIFYHVDPSDVRDQKGKSFEDAFAKHQERFKDRTGKVEWLWSALKEVGKSFKDASSKHKESFKDRTDKVERWRAAFKEVGHLSGYHITGQPKDRCQPEHIKNVVDNISKKLIDNPSQDFKGLVGKDLVGIESRIEEIESMSRFKLADVGILGIYGMGGIGKTTIAEVIYHRNSAGFEGCCYFLPNVREKSKSELIHLRDQLLCKTLEERNLNIGTNILSPSLCDRLQRKKVLIVLDDVDNSMQLNPFFEKHCFGPGSRIIVTSRDKQVLRRVVDKIYEVKGLNDDDALQLLSLSAFKQSHPKEGFVELSKKVVHYAKGVPLALRVLGCALYDRSKSFWEDKLNKLKEIPNPDIDKILKISYDGLDQEVKDIFLDIACFFKGHDRDYVKDILDRHYCSVKCGIIDLVEKSLITISNSMIDIHDLLQQMAWNLIYQESNEPGQRSRLWSPKDIKHVLKNNTGTESVEGMLLDMSKISGELCISPTAFGKMHNLRFLKFYYSKSRERKVFVSERRLESLPDTLTFLYWDCYPSKSLPSSFCPENLVELNMPYSHVKQLWNGVQNLINLKRLDLSWSRHLIEIPDLSRATDLESMMLIDCTRLVKVPSSIRYLNKLSLLNLRNCQNLENFPSSLQLRSLETLNLYGCLNVTNFPEISRNIKTLYLNGTAIEEVPSSIECLSRLRYLDMRQCKRLKILPSSICKLKLLEVLNLKDCLRLESFPEILETMEGLQFLSLCNTSIEELPSSIEHLVGLEDLRLDNSKKLKNLPSSIRKLNSLVLLSLNNCSNITKFPEIPGNLKSLYLSETAIEKIPSSIKCYFELEGLYLENCAELGSLPRYIFESKSLNVLKVSGLSKLEVIQGLLGIVEMVNIHALDGTAQTGNVRSSFMLSTNDSLSINLSWNGAVSLRKSIGNMRSVKELDVSGSSVFEELPVNLENLKSLTKLCLSFCNLIKFPSHLTFISSLTELSLRGNNFETVPESIKQLLKLERLDLSDCKRLQSLPELPPRLHYLDAHACTSLRALSGEFPIPRPWVGQYFKFTNCINLHWKAILAKTQFHIQRIATENWEGYTHISFSIWFSGKEIQEWFSCQNLGSSVKILFIGSDHVCLVYSSYLYHKSLFGHPLDSPMVKKYGVHLPYDQVPYPASKSDAGECNPLMIQPSSPYDPMVEDDTTTKRPRDDYCYDEAKPSGNFRSHVEEEPHPKRLKQMELR